MVSVPFDLVWLIPALPLLGFVVNGLAGSRLGNRAVGIIGSGVVGLSFAVGVWLFVEYIGLPEGGSAHRLLYRWIAAGTFEAHVGYQVDALSLVMALVVSGVAFVIHVYSIGYMHRDAGYARYFSYLNLFTFMMLNLVLADNYLLMFLGWEGVGLCSYLLIGFWYEEDFRAEAGRKAFIVNRIGDAGFIVALLLMFAAFGSLSYADVFAGASDYPVGSVVITGITLLLFVGAAGKSAQIPLHVWLPDAMAGPTPVSALIHAATMVTAGVYMVARSSPLYVLAPASMQVVAVVGAVTALYAATVAIAQTDIKKVLAYSTISQLGYMFMAVGVGAFTAGIFHLVTHAFFKSLLFLCAGSVLHALANEQDLRRMGGLKKHLPVTYWAMVVGALAMAGVPGLSGFFSKDEILWQAYSAPGGHWALWAVGVAVAGLTATYIFRLIYLTFHGEPRWSGGAEPVESPWVMTMPLVVLAALAMVGGYIGLPESLGGANRIRYFLEGSVAAVPSGVGAVHGEPTEYLLMAVSVLVALSGIGFAYLFYLRRPEIAERLSLRFGLVKRVLSRAYYVDEAYNAVLVRPVLRGSYWLWRFFDDRVVDGLVNGAGRVVDMGSGVLRRLQTGYVPNYALSFFVGVIFIMAYYFLM